MTVRLTIWLFVCVLVTWADSANSKQFNPVEIQSVSPGQIEISGDWPDSCVPSEEFTRTEYIDGIMTIISSGYSPTCKQQITPFTITVSYQQLWEFQKTIGDTGRSELLPVQFLFNKYGNSFANLVGFNLVRPATLKGQENDVVPESGLWWPQHGGKYETSGPGIGFSIERQSDQAVIITNWYDTKGSAHWMLATGQIINGIFSGELTTMQDGPAIFDEFKKPFPVFNRLQLIVGFDGPSTATAWIIQSTSDKPASELILKPISLVRFAFGYQSYNRFLKGRWMIISQTEDGLPQLQLLQLQQVGAIGNTITMKDRIEDYRLSCTINKRQPTTPASSCQLLQGYSDVLATMSQIGLDRLEGIDRNGQPIMMIRHESDW